MVIDIVKFFFIYSLVLFAFACGLNQLLWYFSDLERKKCYVLPNGDPDWDNQSDSCMKWRSFANVFESSQSLFWASFGMVDLGNFELTGIKTYTRFWGLLMFGSYSVINVIVLLNLLIAMMSNSYAMIDEHSDTEWKFARTKLWMSYFEEGNTLPPPFNIFPTVKTFRKLFRLRQKDKLRRMSTKRRNREEKERDYRYTSVMRALVWRYISSMHKKCEEDAVTEDDINEVKSDISAFRYDILEVLNNNGMDISSVEKGDKAVLGKKMKIWERRLMKDFKVAPVVTEEEADQLIYEEPPENEDALSKFRRVAKLAVLNSNLHKWGQVITGACLASQIGHCNSKDSFKKQQNLMKAMEEARKFINRSPLPASRSASPIELPDTTGESIVELMKEIEETNESKANNTTQILPSPKNPLQPNVLISPRPSISLSPPTPITQRVKRGKVKENELETISGSPPPEEPETSKEVDDFIMLQSQPESPKSVISDAMIEEPKLEETVSKGNEMKGDEEGQKEDKQDVTEVIKDVSEYAEVKSDLNDTEKGGNVEVDAKSATEGEVDVKISSDQSEKEMVDKKGNETIKPAINKTDKVQESLPSTSKAKILKPQAPAIPESKVKDYSPKLGPPETVQKPENSNITEGPLQTDPKLMEDPKKVESATATKDLIPKPDNLDLNKSPMASRNITRVGDSSGKRRQTRTGWL